jgi:hypothetical protein
MISVVAGTNFVKCCLVLMKKIVATNATRRHNHYPHRAGSCAVTTYRLLPPNTVRIEYLTHSEKSRLTIAPYLCVCVLSQWPGKHSRTLLYSRMQITGNIRCADVRSILDFLNGHLLDLHCVALHECVNTARVNEQTTRLKRGHPCSRLR